MQKIPKREYTAELEEMEQSCLRAENARLKRENDIPGKATAYFARYAL